MIGFAFQYGDLADAAFAALAIVHRINAFIYQHLEDALFGWNDEGQAGALEHNLDCGVFSHRRLLAEYLDAEPLLRRASARQAAFAPASTTVNVDCHGQCRSDPLNLK
jgi:hypothetical protein